MQIRRENLEDALLLQQLIRDVDDEMQWLAEKEPQAASHDLGTSLTAVQSLQKKHQVLERNRLLFPLSSFFLFAEFLSMISLFLFNQGFGSRNLIS